MTGTPALNYVILRHEGIEQPHFDLLFETSPGSDLATWRATEWPVTNLTELTHLRNHRRFYLTHEGAVSGDRGSVRRIHEGTHQIKADNAAELVVLLETNQTLRLKK
jgi:hypothetical protein